MDIEKLTGQERPSNQAGQLAVIASAIDLICHSALHCGFEAIYVRWPDPAGWPGNGTPRGSLDLARAVKPYASNLVRAHLHGCLAAIRRQA